MHDRLRPPVARARILVVEDDVSTRRAIARALGLLGYRVEEAVSGSDALVKLASTPFDAALIDLRQPGVGGIEVMEQARQADPALLVIVLTGHATLESAIAAVKAGAADYLVKPCSNRVIGSAVARALQRRQAALRREYLLSTIAEAAEALQAQQREDAAREAAPDERFLECGSVTLDRARCLAALILEDEDKSFTVQLTSGEAALLGSMMRQPETTLSCSKLARDAFGYQLGEGKAQITVRPHISRLRRKIEPDPANPSLIRTVRGKGYLFSPP